MRTAAIGTSLEVRLDNAACRPYLFVMTTMTTHDHQRQRSHARRQERQRNHARRHERQGCRRGCKQGWRTCGRAGASREAREATEATQATQATEATEAVYVKYVCINLAVHCLVQITEASLSQTLHHSYLLRLLESRSSNESLDKCHLA